MLKNRNEIEPMNLITRVDQIDWNIWKPDHSDTLMFIVDQGQVLLIRKKRGLGAGKINGPGGKMDEGESPLQCAIRETREELHVTPLGIRECGKLRFHSDDFGKILCYVFIAAGFEGSVTETDEAAPVWTPIESIPFHEMWEDDIYWLPHVLFGKSVDARFVFEGESLLDYQIAVDGDLLNLR